jgi:hypothetical protein
MSRKLAIVFAALLAVNAVVGTVALMRTVHLGQDSHTSSNALIAKRATQLDRFEASLRAQLAKQSPPLPKMPSRSASNGAMVSAAAGAVAPRVQYVRPAPIIVHKHRAGGEHEDDGAYAGDGGGGIDD